MTKDTILTFLKENKKFLQERYKVTKIALFGSYSRDDADEESDIDLLVDMPASFDLYYDFKEFLENKLKKKVDIGFEKNLRPFIKESIKEDIIYV